MLPDFVNHDGLCKVIGKYISIVGPLNRKFIIYYQFSNTIVLDINVLDTSLAFCIFSKDDIYLVISV